MKQLTFLLVLLGLFGCNDFISPDNMAEGVEAEERCNNWQEETRKETIRFGMDYSLFNRACKLNERKTMILGYEGEYEPEIVRKIERSALLGQSLQPLS